MNKTSLNEMLLKNFIFFKYYINRAFDSLEHNSLYRWYNILKKKDVFK